MSAGFVRSSEGKRQQYSLFSTQQSIYKENKQQQYYQQWRLQQHQ
jgi:hypothetical protein